MKEADFPRLLQGRMITIDDLQTIRKLINDNPSATRNRLADMLCRLWDWHSPAGKRKLMSSLELMQKLHAAGLINLPPARATSKQNIIAKPHQKQLTLFDEPKKILQEKTLSELLPLHFEQVTAKNKSALWNELIERHHYLASASLFGARIRYLVYSQKEIIAAFAFSAAAWRIKPRESFIGWDDQQRRHNLHLVVNNSRFLIVPWLRCQNLASTLISRAVSILPDDWEMIYGYKPVLLETFVDGERYGGTCYKASNWRYLGFTKGLGRDGYTKKRTLSEKDVFVFPLQKKFRQALLKFPEIN